VKEILSEETLEEQQKGD